MGPRDGSGVGQFLPVVSNATIQVESSLEEASGLPLEVGNFI